MTDRPGASAGFSPLRRLAIAVHALVVAPVMLLALLLVFRAETGGGRCFGLAVLFFGDASFVIWTLRGPQRRLLAVAGCCSACLSGVFLGLSFRHSPGGSQSAMHFRSMGHHKGLLGRWHPANLVPEIDQLKMGLDLLPAADPVMDRRQARTVRRIMLEIYRRMRRDRSFVEAGSALDLCYRELLTGKAEPGHFYEYRSTGPDRDAAMPVIIFLHGSMGNAKAYTWILKDVADRLGMAILAPTFGCGNWRGDRQSETVGRMLRHCRQSRYLDETQVFLAGLSNGGIGCSRACVVHREDIDGAILISPVLEPDLLISAEFAKIAQDLPILVIHGALDRRIPVNFIQDRIADLERTGCLLNSDIIDDADHFLLFTHRQHVAGVLVDWLVSVGTRGSVPSVGRGP